MASVAPSSHGERFGGKNSPSVLQQNDHTDPLKGTISPDTVNFVSFMDAPDQMTQ